MWNKFLLSVCTILLFDLTPFPAEAACNIVNGKTYGDCSGVTVNLGRDAFQDVKNYSSITGLSAGARVLSGGVLSVSGMADRIIIEEGGRADISGMVGSLIVSGAATVSGTVTSAVLSGGGKITIEGVVGSISGVGEAHIREGSVIAGQPMEKNEVRILQ